MKKTIDELIREEQEKVEAEQQILWEGFMANVHRILGDEVLDSLNAQPDESRERTLLFTYHGRRFSISPYSARSLVVRELRGLDDTSFTDASTFLRFLATF